MNVFMISYVPYCLLIWMIYKSTESPAINRFRKKALRFICFSFFLSPLLFSYKGGRTTTLSPEYKFDEEEFIDWMCVPPSNLLDETRYII